MAGESILNPSITVGGYEWMEPVTTLTDFLVALVCWTAFYLFTRASRSRSTAYVWFKYYFLAFAIGMTSAAWLGHGFQAYVAPQCKMIGWICGATGLLFLQIGTLQLIKDHIAKTLAKILPIWFVVQWATAVTLMILLFDFKVTQINSVVALIGAVLPMHYFAFRRLKIAGSRIVLIALGYSLIPGLVYSNQVSISRWFNYHDISHVLMAIFMTIMFVGLHRIIRTNQTD